jgi:uncharacterized protein (DUF2147 family)
MNNMPIRADRSLIAKSFLMAASGAVSTALLLTSVQVAAAPALGGLWEYKDSKGVRAHVRVAVVNGVLSATVEKPFPRKGEPDEPRCEKCPGAFKNKPIRGLRIVWGARLKTDGSYQDGRILDPDNGSIYSVTIRPSADGNSLKIRGFVGVSLLGRTSVWRRI